MLAVVDEVVHRTKISRRSACEALRLPYSSLMRWHGHRQEGVPIVGRPGPAKTEPLNQEGLMEVIRELSHGQKRTRGTGELQQQCRDGISRRDLQALVAAVRQEQRREQAVLERRIQWLQPWLVWSMDDTQLGRLAAGPGYAHVVHDLGSRYTLKALGGERLADGFTVARNLEELFEVYGAPLFLKRDNGGNLNHHAVTALLDRSWVISLNSPSHYPPYNGAMEHKQGELQTHLEARLGPVPVTPRVYDLELELSAHELNHNRRASLDGLTACRALEYGRCCGPHYDRRQRKEVCEEIQALAVDIMTELEDDSPTAAETAWRWAVETWMQQNHIINVTQNGKVLPCFYQFQSH